MASCIKKTLKVLEMFKKRYILILLLILLISAVSAVNASEISETEVNDNVAENTLEISETSAQEDVKIEAGNADYPKTANEKDEVLSVDESRNVVKLESPTHVNLKASAKTVTYGKLQQIKVKVTDDNGKPVEDVAVTFKIYKNNKLVDTQSRYVTGAEGNVYYTTNKLNAGTYTVKYEVRDKDLFQASEITSKLTVKKVKYTIKIKKYTGELDIFVKKNKKPANNVKLKVKIYTGKKYKTIYLKSGYNKKLVKYKGFCAFMTNDLKVGKHKVVISSANKNYQASKTTSIKVTKSIKKDGPILIIVSGGKIKLYSGF